MTEGISQNSEDMLSAEEAAIIEGIYSRDQQAFQEWFSNPAHKQKLSLPDQVIRAFIPLELLKQVTDPTETHIVSKGKPSDRILRLAIFQRQDIPISNPESLTHYAAETMIKAAEHERTRTNPRDHFRRPEAPDDIDSTHASNYELVATNKLTAYDIITHQIILEIPDRDDYPEVLHVGDFSDNDEVRGKGIATSFYTQLRDLARDMGFRYIVGTNNERNIGFFTGKLGRSKLVSIDPSKRVQFNPSGVLDKLDTKTVDFLYPEDKEHYLIPTSLPTQP